MRERKLPIVITVPVNLRNYFPSHTTRNFFGVINVPFQPSHYDGTLESIVKEMKQAFKEQLSEEQIFHTMNSYAALEHNWAVKMVPLFLKDSIPQEHKDGIDMARDYLRRARVLVVCGGKVDETVKNDIATAERLRITATTLDGILPVKGQGRSH